MQIDVLATGSTGNCYMIQADGLPPLLLDAGISLGLIRKRSGFRLSDISGCLISHGHGDHMTAAAALLRLAYIVYASRETIAEKRLNGALTAIPMRKISLSGYDILPFDTEHDAVGSLGYIISAGSERVMYLTDSYYCKYKFTGVTHMLVECNYSDTLLKSNIKAGLIAKPRADRLYGSHMSLEHLLQMLSVYDLSKLKQIYLIHMSDDNADEAGMIDAVKAATGVEVYAAQKNGGVK